MTTTTVSFDRTDRKRTLHLLMSLLMLFLAAALFTACGDRDDDESDGGGKTSKKSAKDADDDEAEASPKSAKGQKDYQNGIAAYEDQDYKTAVKHFKKAAEKGNPDGMLMLGYCYRTGKGVEEVSEEEARTWIREAADTGDAYAQWAYGFTLLYLEKDERNGMKYVNKALKSGGAFAEGLYGTYLYLIAKDEEKGIEYLKRAADKGDISGQFVLGTHYLQNNDGKKAVSCLKKVAAQPIPDEMRPWDYFGLDSTPSISIEMFDKSRRLSVTRLYVVISDVQLMYLHMKGTAGVKKDVKEAKKYLEQAKKNGLSDAYYRSLKKELDATK